MHRRKTDALSTQARHPAGNPQITLKALSYFGDGDLVQLPSQIKERLIKAVAITDLSKLP